MRLLARVVGVLEEPRPGSTAPVPSWSTVSGEPASRLLRSLGSWALVVLVAVGVVLGALLLPDGSAATKPPAHGDTDPSIAVGSDSLRPGGSPADSDARAGSRDLSGEPAHEAPVSAMGTRARRPDAVSPDERLDDVLAAEGGSAGAAAPPWPEIPAGKIEYVIDEPSFIEHPVAPLETVDQIAWRYGVDPDRLRSWNGLSPRANALKDGALLRVEPRQLLPPRMPIEYVVRPGDTWAKIGEAHGVDAADLRAYNRKAEGRLRVGDEIRVWIDPVIFQWIAVDDEPGRPEYLRPGSVGIGPPQKGRLVNGVRLPETEYFHLRLPPSSYGTSHAVKTLMEAIVRFEARCDYAAPLVLGSMSFRHGGPIAGHVSHQTGRDLDIRLPLRSRYPRTAAVHPDRVDWDALWYLLTALRETGEVIVVFFDYDLQEHLWNTAKRLGVSRDERRKMLQWSGGANTPGFVRHSPGHQRHIHVRFTCGPFEAECVAHADHDARD